MSASNRSYGLTIPLVDVLPEPIIANRAPNINDKKYVRGQEWIDKVGQNIWGFIGTLNGDAQWGVLGPVAGSLDTNLQPGSNGTNGITIEENRIRSVGSVSDLSIRIIPKGGNGRIECESDIFLDGEALKFRMTSGSATDSVGEAILGAGVVTIPNTEIATGDLIFVSRVDGGISTALGELIITIIAGVSFTITSKSPSAPAVTETGDVSRLNYVIFGRN